MKVLKYMTFYEFTSKIARVRIGDDVWQSGDGILTADINVNLSENKASSTGSFTLYDPGLKIAAKYRALSIKFGGIIVDSELLNSKVINDQKPDNVPNTSIDGTTPTVSPTASSIPNGTKLTWKDNEMLLVREALKAGWNKNQIIFLLATASHETGDAATKYPVGDTRFLAEQGSDSYLARYANVSGIGNNGRRDWAVKYKGRGYLQITGRGVYETTGKAVGLDLVNNPELAQNPDTAAKIAVYLLKSRPPTGYKNINQFGLLTDKPDFRNARRMVNGIREDQMKQYMEAVRIYRAGGGFEKIRGQQLSNVDELIKSASSEGGGVKAAAKNASPKTTVNQSKVGDWPYPKVAATKKIIVTSGHRLDINSGTSGTTNTSVNYGGETRTKESVATEIAAQVVSSELTKAGFTVIAPPPLPSARGDNARKAYTTSVQQLKESTGAYSLELHFDQPGGGKPGVIAGSKYDVSGKSLSEMDVALAKEFGFFSFYWGLAGKDIRRFPDEKLGSIAKGLTILEIDALNSNLTNLVVSGVANNNFTALKQALLPYAQRIVKALSSITPITPNAENKSKSGLKQFAKTMQGTKNSDDTKRLKTSAQPEEDTRKGTELIIEMMVGSNSFTQLIAFHFIHTEASCSKEYGVEKTSFSGKSVRWKLSRIPQTQSFQNITLREFAQRVAEEYNLKLVMEGQGLSYHYLPQDGQTVYQVLEREARRIGFKISDSPRSNELIIEPYARPKFTGFVVDEELFISCNFSDKATASPRYIPGVLESQLEQNGASNKVSINRQTGVVDQHNVENKTGAMSNGVTGKSAPPSGGIIKPNKSAPKVGIVKLNQLSQALDKQKKAPRESKIVEPEKVTSKTFTRPNNTTVNVENRTQRTKEYLKITDVETKTTTITMGTAIEKTIKKTTTTYTDGITIIETEETDKNGATFSEKIQNQKTNNEIFTTRNLSSSINIGTLNAGIDINDATGLPKVAPGAIDLIDGGAEQDVLLNENSRIKGYEGSLTLRTVKDTLLLVPGEIIALSPRIFNQEFATELRIEEISHSFKDGRTKIRFYIPLMNEPETPNLVQNTKITDIQGQTLGDAINPKATPKATPKASSAGNNSLILPADGPTTSGIGDRVHPLTGIRRMHKGVDIGARDGSPIVAPGNATVIYTKFIDGYGNQVAIALKLPNTGETVFMTFSHGQNGSFKVKAGQQVTKGQTLMLVGSTGLSTGPHLHWETYKGGLGQTLIKPSDIGYRLPRPPKAPFGV